MQMEKILADAKTLIKKYRFMAHQQWARYEAAYPRAAKYTRYVGKAVLWGMAALLFFVFLVWVGVFGRLPSKKELKHIQNYVASEVYGSEGVLLGKYYVENRTNVSLEEISPLAIQALVATEDARFFSHSGIDFRSTMRVLFKSILMGDEGSGGGSTISQQLAKNVFPRKRLWLLTMPVSKVKEIIIARRLERLYTKEELLELYLNTVPFSENIYGIDVAAQRFFAKNPIDLTVEEAAVLIGMLKAPTSYNPNLKPENSLHRRNLVMEQMAKYGYLEAGALDSLKAIPLQLRYKQESSNDGLATYFRAELREFLKDWIKDKYKEDGTPYNIFTDGLKIYTTLNGKMQQYAEEAVAEHFKKLQKDFDAQWRGKQPWKNDDMLLEDMRQSDRYKWLAEAGLSDADIRKEFDKPVKMRLFSWEEEKRDTLLSPMDSLRYYHAMLNVGFMVINPQNGKILVWVGGVNHRIFKYDHVKSRRQVGSTFKPFVYATAIGQGMSPCDYIDNYLRTYPDYNDWTPENADGRYGGAYSMAGALANSVNVISVDVAMRSGIGNIAALARNMGIESPIPLEPSIALGSNEASVMEMVRAYGTFVNRGKRCPRPWYLERIETADGEVLEDFSKKDKDSPYVMKQDQADLVVKMMEGVVDHGTAQRMRYQYGIYSPLAGKTGTTQDQTDGWFMGATPNLVGGVWVGADDPQVRFRTTSLGQGASSALPVFGLFLKKVFADPKFAPLQKARFPDLPEELAWQLDCPDFLGEGQSYTQTPYENASDTLGQTQREQPVVQDILDEINELFFNNRDSLDKAERAQKREERRQKRKEFLDKILHRSVEEEKNQDADDGQ
jgi:penicillin-binding protein 1A